jgi:hypothetical protein
MKKGSSAKTLLQSGIIYSAINFLTGLGNMAFQSVLGHHLKDQGQYGNANSAINGFMPLLGLFSLVAIFAVTHYIAHFNAIGDTARLQGLLAGCRKLLFRLTVVGSVVAVIAIKPLSDFLHYPTSLMLVTLVCTLLSLWTSLATALCQGLAWFKRLAMIGFIAMMLRVVFGYCVTLTWPTPETAILASTFGLLAYLILLYWRKALAVDKSVAAVPPWNHEFVLYLIVSAAYVVGNYCFSFSDLLVMQRNFSGTASADDYTAAERLAVSLPITVAPLLTVLFTNRSIEHTADAFREQMKLLALYAAGLIFGAFCLYLVRHPCLKILGKDTPEAAEMIRRFSVTMVSVGLLQAIGTWALASRWTKISLLYGALGIAYTAIILTVGKTADALLHVMPLAAGAAFVLLLFIWMPAIRSHKPGA